MVVDQRDDFDDIVAFADRVTPATYDQMNKCPACLCELFSEPFQGVSVKAIAIEQEALIMARFEGRPLTDR